VSSAFNLEIPPFFNLDTFNVFPDASRNCAVYILKLESPG
jgi:hypothetical protein